MAYACRNNILVLALAFIMSVFVVSCRKLPSHPSAQLPQGVEIPLDSLYDCLSPTYLQWQDAYIPMQISMTQPAEFQVSGRTTMLRDSLIHLSLRMLGMEVGAALITRDSLFAIDKYHKIYMAEELSSLFSDMPLSISDLQNLLLGQAFKWNDSLEQSQAWGEIVYENSPCLIALHFLMSNAQAACIFPNHTFTSAGIVADSWQLQASTSGQNWNLQWRWQLNNAKWDSGRQVNFKIDKDYQWISADAIMQILKGL